MHVQHLLHIFTNFIHLSQNGVLCILFVLSLLAGGIVNAVYASDNNALFNEICTFEFAIPTESCEDFERVVATEAASAVSYRRIIVAISYVMLISYVSIT